MTNKHNQQTRSNSVQGGEVGDTIKDKGTHKSFLSSPADTKTPQQIKNEVEKEK